MRSRTLAAVSAGAAALIFATAFAPGATAQGTPRSGTSAQIAKGSNTCFKNIRKRHLTGAVIPSANYDDQNSTMASQAADDFTLTQTCVVREVDVLGTLADQTSLDWENVYIYPDAGGAPGMPAIWVQSALPGKQGKNPGNFKIAFGPLTLQPGTYWISVQAQLKSGSWGWANTSKGKGYTAVFQNPNQGYPGCPSWTAIQTCFPGTPGPDLAFALKS